MIPVSWSAKFCAGDALSSEKEGGNARPNIMMMDFRECLMECGLVYLGYIGAAFTWRKVKSENALIGQFEMWVGT